MKKDGLSNFDFQVVETFETKEARFLAEVKLISQFGPYGDGGYNETRGGDGYSHSWSSEQNWLSQFVLKRSMSHMRFPLKRERS
jgi:hypothetical protein